MEFLKIVAEWSAGGIETLGIAIIVLSTIYSMGLFLLLLLRRGEGQSIFKTMRHKLAQGILLGLELLVAADIIHTVAIDLTLRSVAVLGLIVLIRTFLSFSLEVEMTGSWPWRQARSLKPHS